MVIAPLFLHMQNAGFLMMRLISYIYTHPYTHQIHILKLLHPHTHTKILNDILKHIFSKKLAILDIETRGITVKFLNFGMPEIFAVIYLKSKQRDQTLGVFCQNGANGIANTS